MSFAAFGPIMLPGIENAQSQCVSEPPVSKQLQYPEDGLLMRWARNASSARLMAAEPLKIDPRAIPKAPRGESHPQSLRTALNIQSCPVELSSTQWSDSDDSELMAKIPTGPVSPPVIFHHQEGMRSALPKLLHVGNGPQFKPQLQRMSAIANVDFEEICERIWIRDDQRASIFLQTRLRAMVPGEYEVLAAIIKRRALQLMSHRFGNFLVQCLAEVASQSELDELVSMFFGKIVDLSTDPFSCHVIQKVLDVSPPASQHRIGAELMEAATLTMTDSSGSHVWQKYLHLPRVAGYPSATTCAHIAVMRENPVRGWMAIADTAAGALTIKSFLAVLSIGNEREDCLAQLISGLDSLVTRSYAAPLVIRVALMGPSRARALAHILSRAYEYSLDTAGSAVLTTLLERRVPGFAQKLETALFGFYPEVNANPNGRKVLRALAAILGSKK